MWDSVFSTIYNYIFMPIFVLAIVIFFHELGHYLMARYFKIPTPVFSVGFGREIFGFTDKRGTRWKFSIFPLGGYVSMDINDSQPIYQRSLVAVAGPLANFILALLMMIILVNISGAPKSPPLIVAINTDGGAYEAGMRPHDLITAISGEPTPYYIESIGDMIRDAKDGRLEVDILRDGQPQKFIVSVYDKNRVGDFGEDKKQKMMGVVFAGQNLKLLAINKVGQVKTEGDVSLTRAELIKHFGKDVVINFGKGKDREDFLIHMDADLNAGLLDENHMKYSTLVLWDDTKVEFKPVPFGESVMDAFKLVYDACKKTLGVIYQIIVGKKDTGSLGGVVAISSMTGEVAQQAQIVGVFFLIKLIALLSINIGFINLLPFPMLDGGHLLLHAVEAIRKRPLSPKAKGYVYGVSIMFLIILSISVTIRDILERMHS